MKILVIDDEPDVLLLCRVNLAFAGHEVVEARDAPEGLFAAIRERPDVIVLDVMLPHGSGLSVLEELQRRDETRDIPVVMLTAKTRTADERRGFEAGATAYMTKPFAPTSLNEAVMEVAAMTPEQRAEARSRNLRQLAILRNA